MTLTNGEPFVVGEGVSWHTPQGETTEMIKRRLTARVAIKGHHMATSEDNPEYLVRDESGEEAAQSRLH